MKPYIESQYLHVFVTLARTLNMSEAARELGQTPSAISHALKVLETNLGGRVFERSPRHMMLLPMGQTLLPDAVAVLDHLRLLRVRVDALTGRKQTGIRLSITADFAQFLIPAVLQKFRANYSDYPVHIEAHSTAKGTASLTEGEVDLAILTEPARNPALDFTLLGAEELRLIVNSHHEWASLSRIPIADILTRKLLVTDCGGSSTWLTDYFKRDVRDNDPRFEFESEQTINVRLNQNTGIALLPKWSVAAQLDDGIFTQLPLGRAALKRRCVLACRKSYTLNPAETLFANLVKAAIQKRVT